MSRVVIAVRHDGRLVTMGAAELTAAAAARAAAVMLGVSEARRSLVDGSGTELAAAEAVKDGVYELGTLA